MRDNFVDIRNDVYARYAELTPGSRHLFDRASSCMPGGVSGNLRSFEPYPLYMTRGQGSRTWDIDDNEFIDTFLCNGPVLLGYNDPTVAASIQEELPTGSLIYNPALMVECADLFQRLIPCAERVRFVNSGTEAVMFAVRFARAHTGRDGIIKFLGHYHGQDAPFLIGRGRRAEIDSAGVSPEDVANTHVLTYGDIHAVEDVLRRGEIACVLVDPVMHSGGLWPASAEYLAELRALTRRWGVVLIFDEVITGFRLGPGGAQGHYAVVPDLAVFSKAIANGEKLAAFCGRADIMDIVTGDGSAPFDPGKKVFQSGTYNDAIVPLAAARAALRRYQQLSDEGAYEALFARSSELAQGIRERLSKRRVPCTVNQVGSILQVFVGLSDATFEELAEMERGSQALFFLALICEGAFLSVPTSGHVYTSFSHTNEDIQTMLFALDRTLDKYDWSTLWAGGGSSDVHN